MTQYRAWSSVVLQCCEWINSRVHVSKQGVANSIYSWLRVRMWFGGWRHGFMDGLINGWIVWWIDEWVAGCRELVSMRIYLCTYGCICVKIYACIYQIRSCWCHGAAPIAVVSVGVAYNCVVHIGELIDWSCHHSLNQMVVYLIVPIGGFKIPCSTAFY